MSRIRFAASPAAAAKGATTLVLVARTRAWKKTWQAAFGESHWLAPLTKALTAQPTGPEGNIASTLTQTGKNSGPARIVGIALPEKVSRHNAPSASEALFRSLRKISGAGSQKLAVVMAAEDGSQLLPLANAAARALPTYTNRSGEKPRPSLALAAVNQDGSPLRFDVRTKETVEAARWAASLVDTPTCDLDSAGFVRETKKQLRGLDKVRVSEIVGNKLLEQKLGGLHAVGRTAATAPRLLVLEYKPAKAKRHVALVGKGVVYDTGGLSLKGKAGMPGMKSDMGGAAAVAGAFRVLAASRFAQRVTAVIPLAENAIGPNAFRNDDIIHMHSGHTVEINNTDAEGRLLLGDGCSWVARRSNQKPDVIIDAATLTGAQLIATGQAHAAVVSNRAGLEELAVKTGRECGDLTHPLPFAPEFYQSEFSSLVADMKNSVANRANAQSSCAGQFIYAQIDDVNVPWLHVDLAGPAFRFGRGTGFGVALLAELADRVKKSDLKN